MKKLTKKNKKGFTLIELLIVVAIIAILAAIAIPQFSQYRIRAYNGAAESDMRNMKVACEAFKTDWQVYASSAATGVPTAGTIQNGPATFSATVAANSIMTGSPGLPSAGTAFSYGISNGVGTLINTDANGASYTAFTKHTQGDKAFAADSDITSINWKTGVAGTQLQAGDGVDATNNVDNVAATYASKL